MTDSFQFIDIRRQASLLLVEKSGKYFNLEWMGKVHVNQCGELNKKTHACCIAKFSFVPQKNHVFFLFLRQARKGRWHIYKLFRNKVTGEFLQEIWLLSSLFYWEVLHHQSPIIWVIYDTNKTSSWPWWCICES